MAPQQVEKIEFAPGNGMVPEAANPLDVVSGRAADRARPARCHENGGADFSFGKTQCVLACFHVHSTIPIDLAAGGGLFELRAELQKFGAHEMRFGRLVTR